MRTSRIALGRRQATLKAEAVDDGELRRRGIAASIFQREQFVDEDDPETGHLENQDIRTPPLSSPSPVALRSLWSGGAFEMS
jgi:hypothetical protein